MENRPKQERQQERPRERLLSRGAQALTDAELVALVLGTGSGKYSALELARQLILSHGGLHGLLHTDSRTFLAVSGLGPAQYARFRAIREISGRQLREKMQRSDVLRDPAATEAYLRYWLRDRSRETFVCVFLDSRHRVIHCEVLFEGTIDAAAVYPREVVRQSLQHNAAAVILAHNHPSGVAEPSEADRHLTRRLGQALDLVDIRLLDHLVIGEGRATSFARRGIL
ncbi:MAG: DNA repair protein RadC [Xanthomonadales bacterium]|nr:DNA repair protein RadC [Xanthomonadales bacterium]